MRAQHHHRSLPALRMDLTVQYAALLKTANCDIYIMLRVEWVTRQHCIAMMPMLIFHILAIAVFLEPDIHQTIHAETA